MRTNFSKTETIRIFLKKERKPSPLSKVSFYSILLILFTVFNGQILSAQFCGSTNSPSNLLTDGNFETVSTENWDHINANFPVGGGYQVCGNFFAVLEHIVGMGTGAASQSFTSLIPGTVVTFSGYFGVRTQGLNCNPKVMISFYNASGTFISSVSQAITTNVDVAPFGLSFYSISAVIPAGTVTTRPQVSIDCDLLKMDALAFTATSSVGNRVWVDVNGNGIQDGFESGQPGVTATLYSLGADNSPCTADDVAVGSSVTDASGYYFIGNVPVAPGGSNYLIKYTTLPGLAIFTTKNAAGSTTANNSDVNKPTGCTDVFTLALPGESRLDLDAGITGPGGGALPLHTLKLNIAKTSNKTIALTWVAENEVNTKEFVIERSTDGASYRAMGTKPATGNRNIATTYTGDDNIETLLLAKAVYYRIKAVDIDGKAGYSNVIIFRPGKTKVLQVWPNPFKGQINVQIDVQSPNPLYVKVTNISGQVVSSARINTTRGTNFLSVKDLDKLPRGIYQVEVTLDNERVLSQKMIKE
jgi:SdrD B-like domain/Secretion system C-terminal sorting domain